MSVIGRRSASMNVHEWLRQWAVVGTVYALSTAVTYRRYLEWCEGIGRLPVSMSVFSECLAAHGLHRVRERDGAARVWRFVGTFLEEESDVLDGLGQAADRERDGQHRVSINVGVLDVRFEVDHCVIRVPTSLFSKVGRALQVLVHDVEPTERGVS